MARVVVVHGIGNQYLGPRSLAGGVVPALLDGITAAGGCDALDSAGVEIAFYGNLFRAHGVRGDDEPRTAADITDPGEAQLLYAWWAAAAQAEPDRVVSPTAPDVRAPTPLTVQRAVNALLRSRSVPGPLAERFLLGTLRQVRRYFAEDAVRRAATDALLERIMPDTTVVVGHSLGSVVAYEALCAAAPPQVTCLVTLGSPLGLPKLIFDRLRPAPVAGTGAWPGGIRHWSNICDRHDVVASVKRLGPLFDDDSRHVSDRVVDNGFAVHDLRRHLTAQVTGEAILAGLRDAP